MAKFRLLLVAEVDCVHPEGADLQAQLDEYREIIAATYEERRVTLFRPLASDVTDLCQGFSPEGFPRHEPVPTEED
jgi:hypothetical protein